MVHEHNITFLDGRSGELFDRGLAHLTGHRAFEHEGSVHTVMTQRGDERHGFPVSMRYFLNQSFASWCAPVVSSYRRRDGGFVDENQPLRIQPRLLLL